MPKKKGISKAKEIKTLSRGEFGVVRSTQVMPDRTKYTRKVKHKKGLT